MDQATHGGCDKDRGDETEISNSAEAYDRTLAQEQRAPRRHDRGRIRLRIEEERSVRQAQKEYLTPTVTLLGVRKWVPEKVDRKLYSA
jgi:hypothetical protein